MGKKIYIFIIIFIILVAIATGVFFVIKNIEDNTEFIPNSDAQIKNIKKYEKKLLQEYSKEGKKEEFLKIADEIQEKALTYALDNVTEDTNSFAINIEQIRNILKNREFSKLAINYSDVNYWVGTWTIDDKGNIAFSFASNSIKPTWTTDNKVSKYIID